ncbi:hypothetical protein N7508_006864 [Penicillium antarcticum]|uniref:uncharacterized protein n=1 Tax=Penicillium antarcticum TaxID=416450 RepID=UPI0023949C21|nr:uncharacterized protein N7508_006864 [Penicillium antarcticum]KAJ5302001.1 hypothetical protein N7508_006864 [Penicillium antarcticum]
MGNAGGEEEYRFGNTDAYELIHDLLRYAMAPETGPNIAGLVARAPLPQQPSAYQNSILSLYCLYSVQSVGISLGTHVSRAILLAVSDPGL